MNGNGRSVLSRAQVTPASIWTAIDRIALEKGFSPSGLARAAGLDPTALNPSKRHAPDGRTRLPRMETIMALLGTADMSLVEFSVLLEGDRETETQETSPAAARLRFAPLSRLGSDSLFDTAHLPVSHLWAEVASPFVDTGPYDYAIRLDTAAYEPVFRRGSLLLASPDSMIREQDRIVLCGPAPLLGIVQQWAETECRVQPLGGGAEVVLPAPEALEHPVHRVTAGTL
ncbi:helix-turn-helix transcriptional regulator [Acetobacter conturbans]|uniref:Helix-turn-helix transcriptional regulator n=1 Tax=Acetobacter conturbans TaxID=1737472 RepID=A0ABX0K3C8_9PROT|nr:helix-turn-helix transcriptional regulator [Acetobacter conturbans]NHN89140.1 helix-turn-helix transcriptional regulator [Acetobacter conturbans]